MREAKTELLRGTRDRLILKVVAWAPATACFSATPSIDIERLLPGQSGLALFWAPLFGRQRLVASRMEESETGREAKFYSITKNGRRQMDAEVVNWSGSSTRSAGFSAPAARPGPRSELLSVATPYRPFVFYSSLELSHAYLWRKTKRVSFLLETLVCQVALRS